MPSFKIRAPDGQMGFIRSLHPEIKKKIKGAIKMIAADPSAGKQLKGQLEGLRSLRVNKFRIVYRMADPREIQVIAIGPRDRIYEETYRIIGKEIKSPE